MKSNSTSEQDFHNAQGYKERAQIIKNVVKPIIIKEIAGRAIRHIFDHAQSTQGHVGLSLREGTEQERLNILSSTISQLPEWVKNTIKGSPKLKVIFKTNINLNKSYTIQKRDDMTKELTINIKERLTTIGKEIALCLKELGVRKTVFLQFREHNQSIYFFKQSGAVMNTSIPEIVDCVLGELSDEALKCFKEKSTRGTTLYFDFQKEVDQEESPKEPQETSQTQSSPTQEVEETQLTENQLRNFYKRLPKEFRKKFAEEEFGVGTPTNGVFVDKDQPIDEVVVMVLGEPTVYKPHQLVSIKLNKLTE